MSVPRLTDVLQTIQNAAALVLNQAGWTTPTQVVIGQPASTELVKILNAVQAIVTVSDRGVSRNSSRYAVNDLRDLPGTPCPLSVTTVGDVITFSGASGEGVNVVLFVDDPVQDVYFAPAATDSLEMIAATAAAAINGMQIPGITAITNGASVTVVGSPYVRCNVGNSNGSVSQETGRVTRSIDLIVWVSNPADRATTGDILTTQIGTEDRRYLYLSDGSPLEVETRMDGFNDEAQSSYSLYAYHIVLSVEYGLVRITPATTVLAVKNATSVDGAAPITAVFGGS